MDINKEVLDDDPDSLAIEADETIQYDPTDTESGVVAVEPIVVTLGRKKRHDALRKERENI